MLWSVLKHFLLTNYTQTVIALGCHLAKSGNHQ